MVDQPEAPSVSVVIAAGNRRDRAARALASVLDQDGIERAEVILLDAANDGSTLLPRSEESPVRTVGMSERGTFGEIRAEGALRARAPIVAYLEEHAVALPGWLVAIESALASGEYAAASGEVHNLNPGVGISDAIELMNYAPWLPPLRRRERSAIVVGHNASYRRDDLLAFGPELGWYLSCEVVLHWRLGDRGRPLLIDPAIRIGHQNETTIAAICRGYYLWNVSFGAGWSAAEDWPRSRRALQLLGSPWWVLRRTSDVVRRARAPRHRRTLLRHLPAVLVAQSAGAWGIAMGCTRGEGDHGRRFADYELDQDRGPCTSFPP